MRRKMTPPGVQNHLAGRNNQKSIEGAKISKVVENREKSKMGASGWSHFVPYQADIGAALRQVQQEVFELP